MHVFWWIQTFSYKRMGNWWDSHVTEHSQRLVLSLQQDLLEMIFWHKHIPKCICTRTPWNSSFLVWIWLSKLSVMFSKKNLPHIPCCFCQSTHSRQEHSVLKTISPLKRLRHLALLFSGNRATFNQCFEKFFPRFLQIMSGWSREGSACHENLGWDGSCHLRPPRNP